MKAFSKVLASREAKNPKSVRLEDFFFTKKEVFSSEDIKEIEEFIGKEMPNLLNGISYSVDHLSHLFGHNTGKTKTFMYVLSCLRDGDGKSSFRLTQTTGKAYIKCEAAISSEDKVVVEKSIDDFEPSGEFKKEETIEETITDEGGKTLDGDKEESLDSAKEEGKEDSEKESEKSGEEMNLTSGESEKMGESEKAEITKTEDEAGVIDLDEKSEDKSNEESEKLSEESTVANESIADSPVIDKADALKAKYKVDELRDFVINRCKVSKKEAKKMTEVPLVQMLITNLSPEDIDALLA